MARSVFSRLYRGETAFDFIERRKIWYMISAALLAISIGSLIFRGFNLGIDFAGGAVFEFPAGSTTVTQVEETVRDAGVGGQVEVQKVTTAGQEDRYRVQTQELKPAEVTAVTQALTSKFNVPERELSPETVGAKWGATVTRKAIEALLGFLVAVIIYISLRFEPKMAAAGIAALLHDIVITAGIYSIVGFEVTPSTVIAFLTILGYSLYDTVVVFDKVRENTLGLAGGSRMTYSQAANLSLNETLMRSINTSLTSLLPIGSLLFVGAFLLNARTLKDLALALFVGIGASTYSSIFVATPLLAEFKEVEPQYKALRNRVLAKQKALGVPSRLATATAGAGTGAGAARAGGATVAEKGSDAETPAASGAGSGSGSARTASPRPPKKAGARPGKSSGKGKGGGRPSGKKKR